MRIVSVLLGLALLASACGSSEGDDGRIDVVAAFYPLAFAAERIGGESFSVTSLTPPGAEPHDVELTPRDVAHIHEADFVLYVSHGFQPVVERTARQTRGKEVDVVGGIDFLTGTGDEQGRTDPHVWLDPDLFSGVVRRMGAAMGFPGGANRLAAELEGLDDEYRAGLARCASRELVTSHAAFGYLAARYDLRQVAIGGIEPEAEPGAGRLADLAAQIRRDGVRAVFVEPLVSPRVAETLAREAGVATAVLNPIEGLTKDEAERGEDYFSLMRRNLATLREALGCR